MKSLQGTFTSVTGTFTVPTPTGSDGSASAWVGIDGDTCGSAILQTGVDFTVSGGSVSYDCKPYFAVVDHSLIQLLLLAWYEWFPAGAYDFSGISFSAGDTVTLTVTATSTTSGTAVIENVSTGATVTQDLTSSSALCQQNAEWIVEDYEENGGLVPFANFGTVSPDILNELSAHENISGTVQFTGASASTTTGAIGPGSATLIDIEQNNNILTSSSVDDSSVTVTYQ